MLFKVARRAWKSTKEMLGSLAEEHSKSVRAGHRELQSHDQRWGGSSISTDTCRLAQNMHIDGSHPDWWSPPSGNPELTAKTIHDLLEQS